MPRKSNAPAPASVALEATLQRQYDGVRAMWQVQQERIATGVRDRATTRGDDVDHAMAAAQVDEDLALAESMRVHLADLDVARRRCADGSYGTCARCKQAIPAERLSIFPAATLCVPCKAAAERC